MTVAFTTITKNDDTSWTFAWAGSESWRVVLYGIQLVTTTGNSYTARITGFEDFPPPIEVVASADKALSEQFRPYVYVQWYDEGATRYALETSPDGVSGWTEVASFPDNGSWVYTYQSPILTDGTTYHWRVLAESAIGNQSPSRKFNVDMVTPPRPVDEGVNIEYSSGSVVVTEA